MVLKTLRTIVAVPVLVALCLFVAGAVSLDDEAGRVTRVKGSAVAVRNAETRVLAAGDPVLVGDILSTGEESRLEIRMIDGGVFTLGGATAFIVLDYTFGGAGSKGVARLLSAAFEAVSDRLAKLDGPSLVIETEVATIGIRGTKLWAVTMADGLFHVGLLSEGTIVVENQAGRVEITERDFGTHIEGPNAPPSKPAPWPRTMTNMATKIVSFD
jgi:hypothetical protein